MLLRLEVEIGFTIIDACHTNSLELQFRLKLYTALLILFSDAIEDFIVVVFILLVIVGVLI